jgi:hypothetical protein
MLRCFSFRLLQAVSGNHLRLGSKLSCKRRRFTGISRYWPVHLICSQQYRTDEDWFIPTCYNVKHKVLNDSLVAILTKELALQITAQHKREEDSNSVVRVWLKW